MSKNGSEPTASLARPTPAPAASDGTGNRPEGSGLFAGAFAAGSEDKTETSEPGANDTLTKPVKPVIFSPDSDSNRVVRDKEDPSKKKRRSFLKFLKGS